MDETDELLQAHGNQSAICSKAATETVFKMRGQMMVDDGQINCNGVNKVRRQCSEMKNSKTICGYV